MADVVTASGLSTGAVCSYFPSRSDLVLAVVARRDGTRDGSPTRSPLSCSPVWPSTSNPAVGRPTPSSCPDVG